MSTSLIDAAKTTVTLPENWAEMTPEQKASFRKSAKRGNALTGEPIQCQMAGCSYQAHSLISHIKSAHGLGIADYEVACGIPLGTAVLVSPALQEQFETAGAQGANVLALRRKMEAAGVEKSDIDKQLKAGKKADSLNALYNKYMDADWLAEKGITSTSKSKA